jgi:GTP pyrophosphokinase
MVRWCRSTRRCKNGQTVEVTTVKEGGPSRDWLNPELGFLASHRARAKVRAWFNALAMGTKPWRKRPRGG